MMIVIIIGKFVLLLVLFYLLPTLAIINGWSCRFLCVCVHLYSTFFWKITSNTLSKLTIMVVLWELLNWMQMTCKYTQNVLFPVPFAGCIFLLSPYCAFWLRFLLRTNKDCNDLKIRGNNNNNSGCNSGKLINIDFEEEAYKQVVWCWNPGVQRNISFLNCSFSSLAFSVRSVLSWTPSKKLPEQQSKFH